MTDHKNYYEILHVQQDAPEEVIKATYRTMMQKMKMHPDLGGDQTSAALINEAYSVLMDPVARVKYDATLKVITDSSAESAPHSQRSENKGNKPDFTLKTNQCYFCDHPHELGDNVTADSLCSHCGSALFPAAKQVLEKNGHRIIQRVEKQWPISFYVQWPITRGYIAKTQDVSLNGIQILSHNLLSENQIVKLNSHMLDAVAIVVNVRSDHTILRKRWRIGLEFITLRFHQTQGTFLKINA